jgi:3,4-dihydroxy 2-butanone 4-phosphate synthase / GTP cyclohydrolase II
VHGRIGDGQNILVRLHRANVVADVLEGGRGIETALRRFAAEGRGVLVYLRDGTAGVPLTSFADQEGRGTAAARVRLWREVGLGAQILRDLGVTSIRNLASSSRSYVGLSGFGIELIGEEPLEP